MLPTDVYELAGAAEPCLSPDGRRVAYVDWRVDPEANDYRREIWIAEVDGSSPARRLSVEPAGKQSQPRWSPDGRLIAFTSAAGHDPGQLYVVTANGGAPLCLTALAEAVGEPVWSPDSTRIAFTARVQPPALAEKDERRRAPRRITRLQFKLDGVGWTSGRRKHVFTVPADGSQAPRQITEGDYEHSLPAWSPDGRRIALVSCREDDWDISAVSDVYLCDARGGDPVRVTAGDGGCMAPAWSPDGRRIAYIYSRGVLDEPRHGRVAVIGVDGGDPVVLTAALDRNCGPYPLIRGPVWDGGRVLFPVDDRGNVHVYEAAADGSQPPAPVVEGELVVTGLDVAGGTVAYTASTPTGLSELYAGGRRITEVGREFAAGRELLMPERFTARSADGSEVDAWLVRPAGFDPDRRYPLLLTIHGGPFTQYGSNFFDEFQMWAGAGYAVVYSNPRGSSGYSEEWGRAIRGPVGGPGWGSVDYEDLMAVVDEALDRFPFCDPDRMGVLGGSYGGFMTSWIVGHSDRFAAACSERSLNSFVSQYGSSDIGWALSAYTGAYVYEDMAGHLEHSPTTYAEQITTPLLIMHSENDLRCPSEQAEQLFTTLRLLGRDVEMVRFPAESHDLSRSGAPVHRVQRFEIILEWFARYLRPGS
jgi:dipeptidyl aminopeptidase/acylaminoacyl peptidase